MKTKLTAAFLVLVVVAISIGLSFGTSPDDCQSMSSTTEYQIELARRAAL